MKVRFYAVRDNVVGCYGQPIPLHNDAEAIRAVKESIEGAKDLSRAGDLSMYYLYSLDNESGIIVDNKPEFICNVIDFVKWGFYD